MTRGMKCMVNQNCKFSAQSSMLEADLIDQDSQTSVASSSSALWLTERDLVVGGKTFN